MPVMDGAESVRIIREMDSARYKKLPIVALTGNDSVEAKQLFYSVGVTDFLAKPVDIDRLYEIVYKNLPCNIIKTGRKETGNSQKTCAMEIAEPDGISLDDGLKNTGSMELLVKMFGDFYKLIDSKVLKIEKCLADNLIKDYTIEVHALKNTARMIGATELSEKFGHLEQSGNNGNMEVILNETPDVLNMFRQYKDYLKAYAVKYSEKRDAGSDEIMMYLRGIKDSADSFDLDTMDAAMKCLEECRLPAECDELMERLRVFIADVALEDIIKTVEHIMVIMEV